MLPKTHIIAGDFLASIIFLIFPEIGLTGFLLIFLSSFLFDMDHYIVYVLRKKDFSLNKAFYYFKEKKYEKEKRDYILFFHSIEFFIIIFALSVFSQFFLFLLIGLLFHFSLDLIEDIKYNGLSRRKFSFFKYMLKMI